MNIIQGKSVKYLEKLFLIELHSFQICFARSVCMKAIKKNVGSAAKCSKKEIYFVLITSLLPKLPESANKGRLGCIYTLSVVCFLTGKDSPKNFCPIWLNGCFTIVFDIKNKKNTRRAFSRWCNARKITLWRELPFFPPLWSEDRSPCKS